MSTRILSAEIAHETNTFSRIPTDEQAFRDGHFLLTHNTLRLIPSVEKTYRNDLFLLDQEFEFIEVLQIVENLYNNQ